MPPDKQTLKLAIKGICFRSKLKSEYFLSLDNALADPTIHASSWRSVFDGQGAESAVKEHIYTSQMVRLLVLQALIVPKTLANFLIWMGARSGKQDDHWTVCSQFQQEILQQSNQLLDVENIQENVIRGTRSIIPQVMTKPELIPFVAWLLSQGNGVWGYYYKHQVRGEIHEDLSKMKAYARNWQGVEFYLVDDRRWKAILKEIKRYWIRYLVPSEKYRPLAELFDELREAKFAALFYQISSRDVAKNLQIPLSDETLQQCQAHTPPGGEG